MSMFCYQCQETIGNKGCQFAAGACGKKADTACLQDTLIYVLKGIALACENNYSAESMEKSTAWQSL